MDQQSNARWLETLKREKRAKEKWQGKYLTVEDQKVMHEEEQAMAATVKENAKNPNMPHGRLTERDASQLRLAQFDDGLPEQEEAPRPISSHQAARQQVAADVSASRPRSHRFTGDLSTNSMLRDIGPGLWGGVNPGYTITRAHFTSSSHAVHAFDTKEGWGEKVDKEHHMKLDVMLAHADKCLKLGEKPFISGGMKQTAGR